MKRINSKIKKNISYVARLYNDEVGKKNTIKKEKSKDMNINEETKMKLDQLISDDEVKSTVKIKKEKGLIERTKSSKKVLVEGDNRELLRG